LQLPVQTRLQPRLVYHGRLQPEKPIVLKPISLCKYQPPKNRQEPAEIERLRLGPKPNGVLIPIIRLREVAGLPALLRFFLEEKVFLL
jgi:hypothetical protein